jgi:predicted dehydrogenase
MGCGVVADYGHLPAIKQTKGLDLVALFDPNKAAVEHAAQKFGVANAFTDQDAFLDCGLDAVVVTSPAPAHRPNVLGAAERGLHVLCEKPIAMTDDEAEEMIGAMELAGKMLAVGFVYRFSHVAAQMKRWVETGAVGEIRSLRLVYLWDLHGRFEQDKDLNWVEASRWRGRMEEGGPMVDCGVHQIDLARWWLGQEVVRWSAEGAWVVDDYRAPDHMWLHMDHERGTHTLVEMSFSYGHTAKEPAPLFTYELIGSGGVLRYDRNGWLLEARHGQGVLRVPGASEKNFLGMHEAFAHALATGDPSGMPTARDGLIATAIARDATEAISRKTGR